MAVPSADPELRNAVRILRDGGVIAYPTETVFGLGCDPFNESAVRYIGELKGREQSKTMLVVAADRAQVEIIAGPLTGNADTYATRYWPGPLTMVIKPEKPVPGYLLGPTGGIAFRVTSDPVASALCALFEGPLISTSANVAGESPMETAEAIKAKFGDTLDLIIDDGKPRTGTPSTIIDVTGEIATVLRQGAIILPELNGGR